MVGPQATPSATGNTLQKTAGCNGCPDAGATYQQQIPSGDGYVELTASEAATLRYAGLSTANTGTGPAEIKCAIRLESGIAEVRESGVYRSDTTFVTGDVFRVAAQSGIVRYYKNSALFYTSAVAPTDSMLVDTSISKLNGTISNAVISKSQ